MFEYQRISNIIFTHLPSNFQEVKEALSSTVNSASLRVEASNKATKTPRIRFNFLKAHRTRFRTG